MPPDLTAAGYEVGSPEYNALMKNFNERNKTPIPPKKKDDKNGDDDNNDKQARLGGYLAKMGGYRKKLRRYGK